MFEFITRFLAKRLINKNKDSSGKNYSNWESVRSIAFILNGDANINKSAYDNFFSALNKHYQVYYLETKKKQATFSDWTCIVSKNINLIGIPKKEILNELEKGVFDVVVCINSNRSLTASYLCALLKTKLRCGITDVLGELDLVVNTSQNDPLNNLQECIKYLKVIRSS